MIALDYTIRFNLNLTDCVKFPLPYLALKLKKLEINRIRHLSKKHNLSVSVSHSMILIYVYVYRFMYFCGSKTRR